MKKFSLVALGVVALLALTGCATVTNEQRTACSSSGGTVKSEKFVYDTGGFFGDRSTGRLNFCESDGLITQVYNREILELDTSWLGPSANNREIFETCKESEGHVYRTKNGKATRYACVQGGEYVQILK